MTDWGFWTFVATGLYAVISFLQWRAIARQAELTEQIIAATNRATDAANHNATAAFDNAEAAKRNADAAQQSAEALKILNRQWIDVSVFKFEMTAGGPRFEFVLVNRTKLPLTLNRIVVLTSSADALTCRSATNPSRQMTNIPNSLI